MLVGMSQYLLNVIFQRFFKLEDGSEFSQSEAYSEPSKTFKMELFLQKLSIFGKSSILDVWQGSKYALGNPHRQF